MNPYVIGFNIIVIIRKNQLKMDIQCETVLYYLKNALKERKK